MFFSDGSTQIIGHQKHGSNHEDASIFRPFVTLSCRSGWPNPLALKQPFAFKCCPSYPQLFTFHDQTSPNVEKALLTLQKNKRPRLSSHLIALLPACSFPNLDVKNPTCLHPIHKNVVVMHAARYVVCLASERTQATKTILSSLVAQTLPSMYLRLLSRYLPGRKLPSTCE